MSDSKTPIDSVWLRSVGFLPDDSNKGDLFLKIWQPGEPATRTHGDGWTGENLHLFVCEDGSYGFESYDEHGDSVAILSVGIFKTRGEVRRLVRAINGRLREVEANYRTVNDQIAEGEL